MTDLQKYSSVQLLKELLRRNPVSQGPSKSEYADSIRESVIGIGNDNTAFIRLHTDDIEALENITRPVPEEPLIVSDEEIRALKTYTPGDQS